MRKNLSMAKITSVIIIMALLVALFTSCNKQVAVQKPLTLATTTSLNDSGLLDYLKPEFEKDTNIELKIIAQGTGAAIKTGESGDADVLFVHDKKSEEKFVSDGFGVKRIELMYNYFVIVGPTADPAKLKGTENAVDAFKLIASSGSKFVSRGDDSGTNKKELTIWKNAELVPAGDWYISAGKGMGDVLQMASEMGAYTLSDKSTFLSMKDKLNLDILLESAQDMKNTYTIMAVNNEKLTNVNAEGAQAFIKWMTSKKALKMMSDFGKDKYGEALFTVSYKD